METTTIQVSEPTLQVLKILKEETGVKSYDVVIQKVLRKRKEYVKSLAGTYPGLKA